MTATRREIEQAILNLADRAGDSGAGEKLVSDLDDFLDDFRTEALASGEHNGYESGYAAATMIWDDGS